MAVSRALPGLVLLALCALLARAVAPIVGVNHLLLAIAVGFALANVIDLPDWLEPGLATHEHWLAAGIVLMGASVSLGAVREAGIVVLLLVLCTVGTTVLVVETLSRVVFSLNDRFGSLLSAGSAICGVSAVVAVAGAIRARESHVAYAAATVLAFDAVTIVLYPIVGDLLGLSGQVFGIWAGVSMFSTGPVVAVGFAHSDVAGQWATMTKLARNALIGVAVLAYAWVYARDANPTRGANSTDGDGNGSSTAGASPTAGLSSTVRTLWAEFPTFVLGFLALAVLSSLGALSPSHRATFETTSDWVFLLAFVGLGTEIRLAELRRTGVTPAFVVLLSFSVVSTLSLAALLLVV
ncbi:YeiH family protein [Halovivax cerinus]|uniref:YeiH family protein n=1 Tax=Halovivax cerinus TaxID=1487865 RepID=A0ABD5NS85_9EURY|nr:putative sulfate exporter family transporter [Halovivax cerinus]